jgi:hypothetical protein
MARFKVGVQFWPQHTSIDALRDAWKAADALGVDSIWVWDHFFPLRMVATHADAWNAFGPSEGYAHKNAVLDEWCAKVGRDPGEIERTLGMMSPDEIGQVDDYLAAGATHLILGMPDPFDLSPVQRLFDLARD